MMTNFPSPVTVSLTHPAVNILIGFDLTAQFSI